LPTLISFWHHVKGLYRRRVCNFYFTYITARAVDVEIRIYR